MANWHNERTEVPRSLQAVLFILAGASLGVLSSATIIVATANSPIALSVGPGIWMAGLIGGILGLFLGINHKNKRR